MSTVSRCTMLLAFGCASAAIGGGPAWAQEPPNGDFENGELFPWDGSNNVGVSQENVLQGAFSGFLSTGGFVDDEEEVEVVCSTLESEFVFPPSDRTSVEVAFKVRYKTDEGVGPLSNFQDPFHAEFVTAQGAVDLLTIKTDGIFWTEGHPTNTRVLGLEPPPQIPPFETDDGDGDGGFASETPTLTVRSDIELTGCEPVYIKFQICDWEDEVVDSAAFVDAVSISFGEGEGNDDDDGDDDDVDARGEQCPPPDDGPGITEFSTSRGR